MCNPAAGAILLLSALAGRIDPSLPERPNHPGDPIRMTLLASRTRLCRSDGSLRMNETCDRCGPAVRAVYRVYKRGELYLCRHCAPRLWPALSAQDWDISPVNAYAGAPQADGYA
jgi:ribosomal protein S14